MSSADLYLLAFVAYLMQPSGDRPARRVEGCVTRLAGCTISPMTNSAVSKYPVGQRVEVLVFDFDAPGFPETWIAGTVQAVDPCDNGQADVTVLRDRATAGNRVTGVRVGKRGGSGKLRAL